MQAYIDLLDNFIKLGENWFKIVFSRDDIKDEIIRLNTEEQLGELGVKSDNQLVSPDGYAPTTIRERLIAGLQVQHMDLKFTGEFWDTWTVETGDDFIIINADGQKGSRNLFEIYGEDILGLTDQSIDDLSLYIADVLREEIEKL